jgi:UDP-4-keto-D-QuiNAc 4-reductase
MEINKKNKVLVTGADGFIGSNLCTYLREKGYFVRGALRNNLPDISRADDYIRVGQINELTDWVDALKNIDFVVHLAGQAHVMDKQKTDIACLYHRVNALGTKRLAEQAVLAGIRRFIFISSVKVNGEGNQRPYTEKDTPKPQDVYGKSKWEAENLLLSVAAKTGVQTVILRLPLVYGVGVKANFKSLIKLAGSGLPLPFKGINNRRSFIYLGNLVDAISICIAHSLAAGEIFLVSDGQDVSTPDLIKMIAGLLRRRRAPRNDARLFYLYPGILRALCKIIGKAEELEKLTGSLLIDSSKIRNLLGWKPSFTLEEGIRETVKGFEIAPSSPTGLPAMTKDDKTNL